MERLYIKFTTCTCITIRRQILPLVDFTGPDKTFRVRVAALKDIYAVLGRASRSLQNLQLLPWERQSSVKDMIGELNAMSGTLRGVFRGRAALTSSEAIRRELENVGDPEDLPTRWPELAKLRASLTECQVSDCGKVIIFLV